MLSYCVCILYARQQRASDFGKSQSTGKKNQRQLITNEWSQGNWPTLIRSTLQPTDRPTNSDRKRPRQPTEKVLQQDDSVPCLIKEFLMTNFNTKMFFGPMKHKSLKELAMERVQILSVQISVWCIEYNEEWCISFGSLERHVGSSKGGR